MQEIRDEWRKQCPSCHSGDDLSISATVWVDLHHDGTEAQGGHEWDRHSDCMCGCGWFGTVGDAANAYEDARRIDIEVERLVPLMQVDLEGDPFADKPGNDFAAFYEFEYALVAMVEEETPDTTVVHFESSPSIGFPSGHIVSAKPHYIECAPGTYRPFDRDTERLTAAELNHRHGVDNWSHWALVDQEATP